jgi:type II secretion system protein L
MSRKILGLDIRNHSLTAVVLRSSLKESSIDAYAYIPFLHVNEGESGLSGALQTLTEKIDLSDCDCVASIPAHQFSYRNLKVPFKNTRKISMVLPFELEPTLPYQIGSLALDFQTIEALESDENTELIAAAIEKSDLNPYLETLSAVNIDPETLTVSGLPMALCLANQADPGEDQLLVEIDIQHCTLFANVSGQIHFIRSFPVATTAAMRPKILCTQIQRTLAAFDEISQSEFQPLDIIITGNGLSSANLAEDISTILQVPVKKANLANRLGIPIESRSEAAWNHAQMDNALALAIMEIENLKGLNFHKSQFAVQKFWSKHKNQVIKTGILAAAVLALLFFNVLFESYTLNRRLHHLNNQITEIYKATFPKVQKIVDPYQEMKAKLRQAKKDAGFQTETGPGIRSIDIINSISQRIPEETVVDITRLVINPQNVLISGNTNTYNSVEDIRGRLEAVELFKKVTISSSNVDRSGKEVRFMLKVEL